MGIPRVDGWSFSDRQNCELNCGFPSPLLRCRQHKRRQGAMNKLHAIAAAALFAVALTAFAQSDAASYPQPADQADGAVAAGRRRRHHRADDRRAAGAAPRPADRHRQPRRRRRQHRHRARGAGEARRLQPADGLDQPERGQRRTCTRSSASIRSRTSCRSCTSRACRTSSSCRPTRRPSRVKDLVDDGAREARQAELRLGRRRLVAAPRGGACSISATEDRHRARAVQGHLAGRGRPGRRPHLD